MCRERKILVITLRRRTLLKVEDKKNYLEAEKDREGWEGLLCELGGSNVVLVVVLWSVEK